MKKTAMTPKRKLSLRETLEIELQQKLAGAQPIDPDGNWGIMLEVIELWIDRRIAEAFQGGQHAS